MTVFRMRFAWYAVVAFIGSLLLATPDGKAAASDTIRHKDGHSDTQSTTPVIRLRSSDDVLRHIDRTFFTPREPHVLALVHAISEPAPTSRSLPPAGFRFRRPLARSPPAAR
jgi:hypothetical protein